MVIELNKDLGLLRLGAAVVPLKVADVDFNIEVIIKSLKTASVEGVQILTFPEMAITGYTIGDLIHQQVLLENVERGLANLLAATADYNIILIVGAPLVIKQKIYNCAVVLNAGRVLGVIPKMYLPSYKEYYEARHFVSGLGLPLDNIKLFGNETNFGTNLLFSINGFEQAIIGVEICEDLWVPLSPHESQALAGATVLINISASNEILGKADWRRTMLISESGRCLAGYCYVSSGTGESSNDVVFGGHAIIAENGIILRESTRLSSNSQMIIADIDIERLVHDRFVQTSFHSSSSEGGGYRLVKAEVGDIPVQKMYCILNPHPFIPEDQVHRTERCKDIFTMQVASLATKLTGAKISKLILGVSGGLDSTLALLVAAKTMDFLKLSRKHVYAFTLPGFGTTNRTVNNAVKLCDALGVTIEKINITETLERHFKDINHNSEDEDIVFENVQARYRTELLFNIANRLNGIVLGTGDLTEIALGWATFSGDHISHYHINCSVPKTLVRYLIRWVADEEMADSIAHKILLDILATPISPELLRPIKEHIVQKSEDVIGPVELADYYLYPFIRFAMRPGKILVLANEVRNLGLFDGKYSLDDLYRWLKSFLERFFANQFKRTCMPEGPKVGSVSLSPRGDWRMPSDAEVKIWLKELDDTYLRLLPNRKRK